MLFRSHADILQVTDAAVLVNCDDREIWLPLSQIDFSGERGDTNTPISLPEWLAAEKGLSDGDSMTRATVTALLSCPWHFLPCLPEMRPLQRQRKLHA